MPDFSRTCSNIRLEDDSRLLATCRTRDQRPSQTGYNLNNRIANINGQLKWRREGNYEATCRNCHLEFANNNTVTWLICECRRRDQTWRPTQIKLDDGIDNNDGMLQYRPRRIIHDEL